MTGGLVVDGVQALDRLRYGPGSSTTSGCGRGVAFADGGSLLLHDPRRFGSLELAPDESRLGPDALTVTLAELGVAVTPSAGAAPLKARLMDQGRLAGIGNLLADEILWRAGLDPARRTRSPTRSWRALHRAVRSHAAPTGAPRRVAHGRPHGGATRRVGVAPRTAPSCDGPPWVGAPPGGARSHQR